MVSDTYNYFQVKEFIRLSVNAYVFQPNYGYGCEGCGHPMTSNIIITLELE